MRISDWSSDVCSSDLSARKFILAGAGKGLIQDRSENILPGKLLPVWFCSPESIACRNFDDRLSAGGGHRGDEIRRLTLPRNDIGHRLPVDVFPVSSGFIDMLICNLLGTDRVRCVAGLVLTLMYIRRCIV